MVLPGLGGLDTPRTNVGDATYLSHVPDFDVSQEASFQSPTKEGDIFQQLRNGGRPSLRTPRGSNKGGARAPLGSRQNLPEGIGGVEFTPLLKSVTRNSATRRYGGKENSNTGGPVPFSLDKIDEHNDGDSTPVPGGAMDLSSFGLSRNASYVESTPLPQIDSSSIASTPVVMQIRGGGKNGSNKNKSGTADPLQDGNQLSLREQENVIDRIEKENFGLKLKIHFLEEALRKAGPGFSEAALKENTELKVDKVTLQRELHKYKKLVISAETSLETYRYEMQEMQEKMTRRKVDESLRAEVDRLRRDLESKDADVEDLRRDLQAKDAEIEQLQSQGDDQKEKLRDEIEDLEADVREKDRLLSQKEDELEDLQVSTEARMEEDRQRIQQLEEKAGSSDKLDEAKETIEELEADVRRLELQVDEVKEKLEDAVSERKRAEEDLEELQEEMANKSVHTKGLSRQVEEKVARLQGEVDKAQQEYAQLEERHDEQQREADDLKQKLKESRQARDAAERESVAATSQLKEAQADLNMALDQKSLLQTRHDALAAESSSLQRDVARLQKAAAQLESDLEEERQHSQNIEHDLQIQYSNEIDRLNKAITDLQTEIHEKEHLYDIDSEQWDTDRQHLESERDRLQQTIDRLRQAEGALSSKEAQLQEIMDSEKERHAAEEAVLKRQQESLQRQLDTRQETLDGLRKELASVRDQLRTAQLESQKRKDKAERLEDNMDVLQSALQTESDKLRQAEDAAQEERERFQQQLAALRESRAGSASAAAATTAATTAAAQQQQQIEQLRTQLAESGATVSNAHKEKQNLQDQLANVNLDLHSLRASLAETKAERDEIEEQLRQAQQHGGTETFRVDQERIDLRTSKLRLDGEVRRLKDENRSLADQCQTLEKTLEEELDKAATEEERLGQEVRKLQQQQSVRVRSSATESQELQAARRTIRDLERQIEDYEAAAEVAAAATATTVAAAATTTLAATGTSDDTSELFLMRRDLSAARAKEREYLQREATHKDAVKALRRQIADLERAAHEAEISRLMGSPSVTEELAGGGASMVSVGTATRNKAEIAQLREQLTEALQAGHDLRRTVRELERKAAAAAASVSTLQTRIDEAEEERAVLEQELDEAQDAAAEAADVHSRHEATLRKVQSKLERYRSERDELALALADAQSSNHGSHGSGSGEISREERSNLHAMLRKTQVEAEALEHELRDHRQALDNAVHAEDVLRTKLERARGERAAYRSEAERLQQEVAVLQQAASQTNAALHYGTAGGDMTYENNQTRDVVLASKKVAMASANANANLHGPDTDALVRAAEDQSIRHRKELRGLHMQIAWMQARWEREARLRNGAVLGKHLVSQDLEMRIACNNADLRMLQDILQQLGIQKMALRSDIPEKPASSSKRPSLRKVATAVRFIVRAQKAAGTWAQHEATRARLAAAAEDMQKAERMQQMRAAWRVQLANAAKVAA